MDVLVWLRSLGLGKYEAAFRENEITEKVLPNLTAEDLKDLGVSIVGHRRTLLDAIAALRAHPENMVAAAGPSSDASLRMSSTVSSGTDYVERFGAEWLAVSKAPFEQRPRRDGMY